MYTVRDEEKNILSYVDFLRLCNLINELLDMDIGFFTGCITFPLSYSKRYIQWRELFITYLENDIKEIDTIRYGDYPITSFFKQNPIER